MSFVTSEAATAIATDKARSSTTITPLGSREAEVIVVGAGAVGLLTALKLGRAGVDTIVLEAYNSILEAPRAIAYMPVVSQELRKLGIFEKLQAQGIMNTDGVTWRDIAGTPLAAFPAAEHVLTLGQDKVARAVLDTIRDECPSVTVIFGQRCVGLEQQEGRVRVLTNSNEDDYEFSATYVVGCDGANSAVRRMSLIRFDGFTWRNFRFTAADVEYDFQKHCGLPVANFVVDTEDWAVIAKTGRENVWRVCYGERPHLPADEASIRQRSDARIRRWIGNMNRDGDTAYALRRLKPYWAHQRCADVYRKGNVLLAGDAAHSNNPVGGLGLTSGILDAVVVGNALVRHLRGGEPDAVLTAAVAARRDTWVRVSNPVSQQNFRRLCSAETADAAERDAFFGRLNSADPEFLAMLANHAMLLPDSFESAAPA
ncbi:hypothetical protein SCUCBS95973_001616 [Sporothrix curviconia]|uniref:FAD-binding domain-containing protein n=1 Tax=Sporothrix curviconia TaxID=1260050 RepID=A0ABP0B0B0_9PEZI